MKHPPAGFQGAGTIDCARVCAGGTLILGHPARNVRANILARHANETAEEFC